VVLLSTREPGNSDVYARRVDGTGTETRLPTCHAPSLDVEPTRDTSSLILRLGTPPTRDIVLWRSGATTLLVASAEFEEIMPVLSPDGRWLAYVSNESGRNQVFVRPFPRVDDARWQVSRDGGKNPIWAHSGRELFFRPVHLRC
jgi:hypothetical protein